MPTVRHCYLAGSLLALFIVACSGSALVEPVADAASAAGSAAASGPKVIAPSGTSAVTVSESRIDVSWQDNSTNEIGFEVHRSTNGPSGTFTRWISTGIDVTSYSDGGLNHSWQYCYKVRGVRSTGNKTSYSAFSTTACATTLVLPVPVAPSGANAWPGGSAGAWVTWIDNSANEAGFLVERSLDVGSTWTTAATVGPNEYYIFDGERASEQQVCYRVHAFNAGGDSPVSNTDCTTPPAGPTDLTATLIDGETMEVELTWTDNSAVEDGYEVWADPCCDPSHPVSLPANSTSFRFYWNFYAESFSVAARSDGGYSDVASSATPTIP